MITSYSPAATSLAPDASRLSAFGTGRLDRSACVARPRRPAQRRVTTGKEVESQFVRYLPVERDQSDSRIVLLGMGRSVVQPGQPYPNSAAHPKMYRLDWRTGRVLPEMQLLLLTDARGEFESRQTGRIPIIGSAVVVLFPGVWHRYRPDGSHGWTERWVSLNSWAAERFIEAGIMRPDHPVIATGQMQSSVQAFDQLARHLCERPARQSADLSQAAVELVQITTGSQRCRAVVCQRSDMADPTDFDPIVEQAREFIWNHNHLRTVCVSEVANQLPVTRRTLDRRFARALGHSVLDEINACRSWRAKRLLEQTDLLIKTVAYLSGFPSRERMRLLFLAEEGLTPSEYRDRMTEQLRAEAACLETGHFEPAGIED